MPTKLPTFQDDLAQLDLEIPTADLTTQLVPRKTDKLPGEFDLSIPQAAGQSAKTKVPVNTRFGEKSGADIFSGGINYGTDFAASRGTRVATPEGNWQVVEAFDKATIEGPENAERGINRGYGNSVLIQNQETGEKLRFSHLTPGGVRVRQGQMLPGGSLVGLTGSTGNTAGQTGQHLDLEYYNPQGTISDVERTPYANQVFGVNAGGAGGDVRRGFFRTLFEGPQAMGKSIANAGNKIFMGNRHDRREMETGRVMQDLLGRQAVRAAESGDIEASKRIGNLERQQSASIANRFGEQGMEGREDFKRTLTGGARTLLTGLGLAAPATRMVPAMALGAGVSGAIGKLTGQNAAESAGRGAANALKVVGLTGLTGKAINQFVGRSHSTAGRSLLSGMANVVEDEGFTVSTEGRQSTGRERLFSFAIGSLAGAAGSIANKRKLAKEAVKQMEADNIEITPSGQPRDTRNGQFLEKPVQYINDMWKNKVKAKFDDSDIKFNNRGSVQLGPKTDDKAIEEALASGKTFGELQKINQRQTGLGELADIDDLTQQAKSPQRDQQIADLTQKILDAPKNSPLAAYQSSAKEYFKEIVGQPFDSFQNIRTSGVVNRALPGGTPFGQSQPVPSNAPLPAKTIEPIPRSAVERMTGHGGGGSLFQQDLAKFRE
ncbi:MAG: hypothetical protein DRN81_03800 [Thermoproteota archaeon]|nr:MAG: hypothetical protein DRN81_03800 [Candidatus Korarchaeota archaeon]